MLRVDTMVAKVFSRKTKESSQMLCSAIGSGDWWSVVRCSDGLVNEATVY